MTRHPALRNLSSDHHIALVQARRLRGADDASRSAVAAEFLTFFREHANRHFREEEEALLPFFARWGDVGAEPIRRMQQEHILIRRDIALIADGTLPGGSALLRTSALHALGARLDDHVRLEEREVFPLIEAALPPHALDELTEYLAAWGGSSAENRRALLRQNGR